MHAQYEHSPPTSSRSTMAALSPPATTRSATFSPTGPAPMITTSYVASPVTSGPRGRARRSAETHGGNQEEDGAAHRVTGDAGQHRIVLRRHHDETRTNHCGKTTADDHRPLPAQSPSEPGDRESQLDRSGEHGPGAEDPQHRGGPVGGRHGHGNGGHGADDRVDKLCPDVAPIPGPSLSTGVQQRSGYVEDGIEDQQYNDESRQTGAGGEDARRRQSGAQHTG